MIAFFILFIFFIIHISFSHIQTICLLIGLWAFLCLGSCLLRNQRIFPMWMTHTVCTPPTVFQESIFPFLGDLQSFLLLLYWLVSLSTLLETSNGIRTDWTFFWGSLIGLLTEYNRIFLLFFFVLYLQVDWAIAPLDGQHWMSSTFRPANEVRRAAAGFCFCSRRSLPISRPLGREQKSNRETIEEN